MIVRKSIRSTRNQLVSGLVNQETSSFVFEYPEDVPHPENIPSYHIWFINLEHRKDRLDFIIEQLRTAGFQENQWTRIDAVKHSKGALGCSKSHVKLLEEAYNTVFEYVIVFEDDFMWKQPDNKIRYQIETILSERTFDGFVLEDQNWMINTFKPNKWTIVKTRPTTGTAGYIVRRNYIPVLLDCFRNSVFTQERFNRILPVDVAWQPIQVRDNWLTGYPCIGKQQDEFYSDILKKVDKRTFN
jgi:GR25 family glycosyltransferase involved in LPS biosynthesis